LREGTNTLAAEVHLASGASSSLSFDLQLIGAEAPFITGLTRQASQAKIFLTGSSNAPTTIQASVNFLTWTNVGNLILTNGTGMFSDPAPATYDHHFYRASRAIP
jgi:phosphoribosylamine-glycine ligase